MVKIWRRFRDWLIRKLGGFTREEMLETVEEWQDKVNAAEDHCAFLALRNDMQKKNIDQLLEETGRLKMELDRNPPAWAALRETETLYPRTLQAEWVYQSYPEAAVDMDKVAKERVTRQMLDGVREHIHYSFEHDFFGNSRVIATLRILKEADGSMERDCRGAENASQ